MKPLSIWHFWAEGAFWLLVVVGWCFGLACLVVFATGCDSAIATQGEQGPAGEQGPQGARGERGPAGELREPYVNRVEETVEVGEDAAVVAHCNVGDFLVAGGCEWGNLPLTFATHPLVTRDEEGFDRPTGWVCIARDLSTLSVVRTHAVCIPSGEP